MPADLHKRELRKLKRKLKRAGSKHRRRDLKQQLVENPEGQRREGFQKGPVTKLPSFPGHPETPSIDTAVFGRRQMGNSYKTLVFSRKKSFTALPEGATEVEEDFGKFSSVNFNGLDQDATRKRGDDPS